MVADVGADVADVVVDVGGADLGPADDDAALLVERRVSWRPMGNC